PFAEVIAKHNLCYIETVAGPAELIIELHRFESLEQWKSVADHLYRSLDPAYFEQVRPLLQRQESGFFVHPAIDALAPDWHGGSLPSPMASDSGRVDLRDVHVVETVYDLYPGGLPFFWKALQAFATVTPELARHQLMFIHSAIA